VDLVDQPLQTVLDGTGHRSPELGGSTASILAALIGLSLIRMAVEVSLGGEGSRDELGQALATLDRQSAVLADLADADQQAFQAYLTALKGRRGSTQSTADNHAASAVRDQAPLGEEAVRRAGTLATQTPVQAAQVIVEALERAATTAEKIKETVASDIFGGVALLNGALIGVLLAVDINLKSGTPQSRDEMSRERDGLFRRGKAAFATIEMRAQAAGYQL
jgi:formiminotetrahydrofolate cyclodeaminase